MLLAPERIMATAIQEVENRAPAAQRMSGAALVDGATTGKIGAGGPAIDPRPPVRPLIRQYILQNFLFTDDPATLADDDSFLQLGIIDSVGALEITLFLEQTFCFAVKEDEMLPENLDSVERLAAFVERRRQGG